MTSTYQNQKELINAQNGTYEVIKAIATGNFGSVYKAKREQDGKEFVIKCESLKMKSSLLRQASMVLASLNYPSPYFMSIEERGTVPFRFLFVVMPLYGENLIEVMNNQCSNKKFSLASALHLAEQSLSAIRDLHRNGFIHRDIKPTHFCIGLEENQTNHQIFLIDFGLCRRPRYAKGDENEEMIRKNSILYRGVVRYASLNAHANKDLGYRDDMESWWFMCLELFIGNLPWGLLNKQSEKDVINLKTSLNDPNVLKPVWKVPPAAITVFFDMLRTIRATPDIADFVEYDRVAEGLRAIFEITKTNPLEPPDWDGMSDYKGPAYQSIAMIPPAEVGMKEQDFAQGEGNLNNKENQNQDNKKATKNNKKKTKKSKKNKGDRTRTEDNDENEGNETKDKKKGKKKHGKKNKTIEEN